MSINLEAFEWLRKRTYAHARTCGESGREKNALEAWCNQQLQAWLAKHPEREEIEPSHVAATARSVAQYVSKNYKPHRAPPKSTRDQRLTEQRLSTWAADEVRREGKRPTTRRVASAMGVSKSKAGRLLAREDVAPVRDRRKAPLRSVALQVLKTLEAMLPRESSTVVSLDDLAGRIWPRSTNEATGRQHRKRIRDALSEIETARLGFNIVPSSTLAAVQRGRRWKPGQANAALAAAEAAPGLLYPIDALPERPVGGSFWASPEIQDVMMMLRIAAQERLPFHPLARFIHAHRLVIDPQPLLDIAWRFSQPEYSRDGMLEQMRRKASHLIDPRWNDGRRYLYGPLHRLVNSIHLLTEDGYWGRPAPDALDTALRVTHYLDHVDESARTRIDMLRAIIEALWENDDRMDPKAAVVACRQLALAEEAGQWTPADGHLLRPEPTFAKALEVQDDIPF
ncbi:hypothetical protein [Microvirga calopogonii]|uniref:hypothetical protein n=1 Tax=Microvirga calopogonii TaxID=2078013 RepID=UPI0013B45099|nr:hypothetical protein [Microvirga calopogonii]